MGEWEIHSVSGRLLDNLGELACMCISPLAVCTCAIFELSFISQLFGHENVSVLDGGLERWITDGYETTNMMVKKRV